MTTKVPAAATTSRLLDEWALPAWLAQDLTPISEVGLNGRARRALQRTGLRTIADLASLPVGVLWETRNIGAGTVEVIRSALTTYAEQGAPRSPSSGRGVQQEPAAPVVLRATGGFCEVVRLWMANLSDRDKFVATARLGLDGGASRSLDEIAAGLHITRERVRQLACKTYNRLTCLKEGALLQPHGVALGRFLSHKDGLATEDEVRRELSLHVNLGGYDPVLCCKIIAEATDEFRWHTALGVLSSSSVNQRDISLIRKELRRLLPERTHSIPLSHLLLACANSMSFREACGEQPEAFLTACLRTDPDVTMCEGEVTWPTRVAKSAGRVIDALERIGRPARCWDIVTKLNEDLAAEDRVTYQDVYQVLLRYSSLFLRVEKGVYGLPGWKLEPRSRRPELL